MRWFALTLLFVSSAAWAGGFSLRSADFKPDQTIPVQYTYKGFGCTGNDVSPELHWTGAPAGTKSFAITVFDPDAPTGGGWWHWVVYDIPATVHRLPRGASTNAMPKGAVQGLNDFGTHSYGGPCPPEGDQPHGYVFTVFALDAPKLKLPATASSDMIGFVLHYHTLAKASFTAYYGRH